MKKVVCDRCGREQEEGQYPQRIIQVVVSLGDLEMMGSQQSETKDLCLDCRRGLRDYLWPVPRAAEGTK